MSCAVMFLNVNEIVWIPTDWIYNLNVVNQFNHEGVNSSETQIIFYSDDRCEAPDFKLPIHQEFGERGLYLGKIYAFFGKYFRICDA